MISCMVVEETRCDVPTLWFQVSLREENERRRQEKKVGKTRAKCPFVWKSAVGLFFVCGQPSADPGERLRPASDLGRHEAPTSWATSDKPSNQTHGSRAVCLVPKQTERLKIIRYQTLCLIVNAEGVGMHEDQ